MERIKLGLSFCEHKVFFDLFGHTFVLCTPLFIQTYLDILERSFRKFIENVHCFFVPLVEYSCITNAMTLRSQSWSPAQQPRPEGTRVHVSPAPIEAFLQARKPASSARPVPEPIFKCQVAHQMGLTAKTVALKAWRGGCLLITGQLEPQVELTVSHPAAQCTLMGL